MKKELKNLYTLELNLNILLSINLCIFEFPFYKIVKKLLYEIIHNKKFNVSSEYNFYIFTFHQVNKRHYHDSWDLAEVMNDNGQ